jgi:hypothetical protein
MLNFIQTDPHGTVPIGLDFDSGVEMSARNVSNVFLDGSVRVDTQKILFQENKSANLLIFKIFVSALC